ncbi:branched-chain amino acid ABC transporter permease [Microbacterium sp. STN6]|uniref:branched-chain amino acid ABC transporter permease n=1 Tax=Microbacterium sp. STN6 TaxID=2995588 RepID=UPI002260D917|nr:branched-chain amino acid ABC transporter permease [Microbacterium sp. STN6]MCX7523301.1 branched-chain amino acid ABC transporter permease [Microbacterium sp. STN6]
MNDFITYLVSGVAIGCAFALIGSGFVVVHRVTRVVNFTQGTLAVFGGLIASTLLKGALPHGIAEIVAVLSAGVIGLIFGFIATGKRGTPPLISLLITLGLSTLSAAFFILFWGQNPISPPGIGGATDVLGARIETQRLLVVVVTVIAFVVLSLFFDRSYVGKGLTAAASNPRAARLVGINVRWMGFLSFGIAGVLGGLAGVLIAPTNAVSFASDLPLALGGFAAAVFGGLVSVWRTLLGGIVLGVVGQLVAGYLSGSYQTEVALLMMLAIMIVRYKSLSAEEAK